MNDQVPVQVRRSQLTPVGFLKFAEAQCLCPPRNLYQDLIDSPLASHYRCVETLYMKPWRINWSRAVLDQSEASRRMPK